MKRASLHVTQRGIGIIEVLVAVLVLSVGLLGLAGLQMRTLRNSSSSMERNIAVMETHAIADAMRADRTKAINGDFDLAVADDPPGGTTFAEVVLASWRTNIANGLGDDAKGGVDCNGALCTITIQWNDSRGSASAAEAEDDEEHQVVTQVQL